MVSTMVSKWCDLGIRNYPQYLWCFFGALWHLFAGATICSISSCFFLFSSGVVCCFLFLLPPMTVPFKAYDWVVGVFVPFPSSPFFIRVPPMWFSSFSFSEETLERVGCGICEAFVEHLGLCSRCVAFPELAAPVVLHLRRRGLRKLWREGSRGDGGWGGPVRVPFFVFLVFVCVCVFCFLFFGGELGVVVFLFVCLCFCFVFFGGETPQVGLHSLAQRLPSLAHFES